MNSKIYTYGNLNKFSNLLFLLFSILFISAGLFFLYGSILSIFNLGGAESSAAFTLFLYFLGFGVWSPFIFIFTACLRTDVEVKDDGLLIIFLFKTLHVKWEDISILKPARYLDFVWRDKTL